MIPASILFLLFSIVLFCFCFAFTPSFLSVPVFFFFSLFFPLIFLINFSSFYLLLVFQFYQKLVFERFPEN